ncbi:CYFA0S01e18492g1_1 [Cyberlindnera fabianii]|uniref:carnosine N-methyltransferase n=1 Tax=Cyberlindnera fabianii TaxID=36022 RepID=A0A061AT16_CYBFA|nr:CYFA0S01e18492g1_1 [Cyberlindnera fabianii]
MEQEEQRALKDVLTAFYNYEQHARREILIPKQRKFDSLTLEEQTLIPWFTDYIRTLEHCIRQNGEFCRTLATTVASQWGVEDPPTEWGSAKYSDYDKVKYVFKQMVREWSSEGKLEREVAFTRFFQVLETEYPQFDKRQSVKILVPGAGLGRLNYECVKRGFWCQGNEFSYHMLLASNYVLNSTYSVSSDSVFPYIHSGSNQVSRQWQTRPIFFPDEHSASELSALQTLHQKVPFAELMSIASGSFTDLYGPNDLSTSRHFSQEPQAAEFRQYNKGQFQCVITNFFIDTSPNVIEYLKTLHHCLSDNGLWLNFGPLLWHFEDADDTEEIIHPDGSKHVSPISGLEMSLEDLITLAERWFIFEKRESAIDCSYSSDTRAMGGWRYKCEYWVARKRDDVEGTDLTGGMTI